MYLTTTILMKCLLNIKRRNCELYNHMYKSCRFYCTSEKRKIGKFLEGNKLITKNLLIEHENDIINVLKDSRRTKNEINVQNVIRLLQAYSKNKYKNDAISDLIIKYIKHNVEDISLIRLCVCTNYLINLKVKNNQTFDYVIINSFIKKLKNDEHIDLYGICLILKYIIHKKIQNRELIYMLCELTKSKIKINCNSYDLYNLILSFLSIQNERFIKNCSFYNDITQINQQNDISKQVYDNGKINISTISYNNEENIFQDKFHINNAKNLSPNFNEVEKLMESNIYNLLYYYINFENVKTSEIILIINQLSIIRSSCFFHKMNLSKKEKTNIYEKYLKKINFNENIEAKLTALLLFTIQRIITSGEVSIETVYETLVGCYNHFQLFTIKTKDHAQLLINDKYRNEPKYKDKNNWIKQLENVKKSEVNPKELTRKNEMKNDNFNNTNNMRAHFTIQEIGMIFQFYDCFVNIKKKKNSGNIYTNEYTNTIIMNNKFLKESKPDKTKQIIDTYEIKNIMSEVENKSENFFFNILNNLKSCINTLKKCLYFYSLYNNDEVKKMNTLDFCTIFKGFCKIYDDTLLDKNILKFFENFLNINQNKFTINEIKSILTLLFEKRNSDLFENLCNTTKIKFLNTIQNMLIKCVLRLNEKEIYQERIKIKQKQNEQTIEEYIMCFYYLSFMNFNANTYMLLNNYIMKNVRKNAFKKNIPYIIISKFNYHKLETKSLKVHQTINHEEYAKWKENKQKNLKSEEDTHSRVDNKNILTNNLNGYKDLFPINNIKYVEKENGNNNNYYKYNYANNDIDRIHILYKLITKHFDQCKIYYILNSVYVLTKFVKEKKNNSNSLILFSNFNLNNIFDKLHNRLYSNFQSNPKLAKINYDYFINFVKYNYCLSFFNYYINLNHLLKKNIHYWYTGFVHNFYTPFNTYLMTNFLLNYEHSLINKNYSLSLTPQNILPNIKEVTSILNTIKNEKTELLYNFMNYINLYYNILTINDIIYIIKSLKFLTPEINHKDTITILGKLLKIKLSEQIKISTISELLIEYIKFLYHLELYKSDFFQKYNHLIANHLIIIFKAILKNIMNSSENNYIGMLQLSIMYITYFIKNPEYILNSLYLNQLQKINYFINLSLMDLDKYSQSCTFQLQILKVLQNITKKLDKKIMNEYRIYNTPYTVDIFIK
ncbi:conserved Plasmodium protein, unknown function [Plasmodium berghei]|uniref:Uncharacterized protein n=1 Tax=Plasmodium berghei TaxID=5821 RepID=A0A0Y9WLL5_PLABE|nr:conserved Plasmodium protein, unknown function [Plasmodium berghei]